MIRKVLFVIKKIVSVMAISIVLSLTVLGCSKTTQSPVDKKASEPTTAVPAKQEENPTANINDAKAEAEVNALRGQLNIPTPTIQTTGEAHTASGTVTNQSLQKVSLELKITLYETDSGIFPTNTTVVTVDPGATASYQLELLEKFKTYKEARVVIKTIKVVK